MKDQHQGPEVPLEQRLETRRRGCVVAVGLSQERYSQSLSAADYCSPVSHPYL